MPAADTAHILQLGLKLKGTWGTKGAERGRSHDGVMMALEGKKQVQKDEDLGEEWTGRWCEGCASGTKGQIIDKIDVARSEQTLTS